MIKKVVFWTYMEVKSKNNTKESAGNNDPSKIAEILGLMEETEKNKEWLFQQIKKNHLKLNVKRTTNSFEILKLCPGEFLSELLKILKAKDFDDIGDINSLTKTYHWFFTDIVSGANPTIPTKGQALKVVATTCPSTGTRTTSATPSGTP